jgi:hypothetical protein
MLRKLLLAQKGCLQKMPSKHLLSQVVMKLQQLLPAMKLMQENLQVLARCLQRCRQQIQQMQQMQQMQAELTPAH